MCNGHVVVIMCMTYLHFLSGRLPALPQQHVLLPQLSVLLLQTLQLALVPRLQGQHFLLQAVDPFLYF